MKSRKKNLGVRRSLNATDACFVALSRWKIALIAFSCKNSGSEATDTFPFFTFIWNYEDKGGGKWRFLTSM